MSALAMEAARLINMLPEADQTFACEFIKKLVLAWDPDFTKLTEEEARLLASAKESGFVPEQEIDWNDLSAYAE